MAVDVERINRVTQAIADMGEGYLAMTMKEWMLEAVEKLEAEGVPGYGEVKEIEAKDASEISS